MTHRALDEMVAALRRKGVETFATLVLQAVGGNEFYRLRLQAVLGEEADTLLAAVRKEYPAVRLRRSGQFLCFEDVEAAAALLSDLTQRPA